MTTMNHHKKPHSGILFGLPPEMVLQVLQHLDIRDISRLARVSRSVYQYIQPELYRHAAKSWIDQDTTFLHQACGRADIQLIRKLLQFGGNPSIQNRSGYLPIHVAAGNGGEEAIECLVAHGASVNAIDTGGRTPLHHAIGSPSSVQSAVIHKLVKLGAKVDTKNAEGWTPLQEALSPYGPEFEAMRALVELGASTDVVDEDGKLPLQAALDLYRERRSEHSFQQQIDEDYDERSSSDSHSIFESTETGLARERKEKAGEILQFLIQHSGQDIREYSDLESLDNEPVESPDADSTGGPSDNTEINP